MKFLLVLFLAGLGLTAAASFSPQFLKEDVQSYNDQDFKRAVLGVEGEGDDLVENLRERFEEILEKIKDAIENRKIIGGNVVAKLREVYNEMKEKSIPFGEKAKELLEQLKEKATGIWKRILDKINPSQRSVEARGTGAENLKERLEELLEKLKESFRDRKLPGRGFLSKLRQIRDEMRQKKVPLGEKLKEMIEKLKENTTGVWRRILDRIGSHSPRSEVFPAEDPKTELEETLKKHYENILEKLKDIIENGKTYKDDLVEKAKEIAQKLKDMQVDIGDHAKQLLKDLKEKAKDYWNKILDKLIPYSESHAQVFMEDPKTELGKVLQKHYEDILEKINDIFENGKTYKEDLVEKAKEIAQKLKDMQVDIGDHARQLLKDMKKKAKDYFNKIMDKLIPDSESHAQVFMEDPKTELGKVLQKHYEDILEKINDIFENGKTYKEDLVEKAKEIAQKLKDMQVDIGDHARQLLKDMKKKAKDYFNKIMDKLIPDSESHAQVFMEEDQQARNLRERLNEILDIVKDGFETRTTIGGQYLAHLEAVWNEMKEKSIPPGDRAIQMIEELKRKTNGVWKRLLFKLIPDEE